MSGNVWMFSDEIDDEDLEFMSHDWDDNGNNSMKRYKKKSFGRYQRVIHSNGESLKTER